MSDRSRGNDVLTGLVAGAVMGFVAGLLLAPKSGKETRADIKRKAGQAWSYAAERLDMLQEELSALIEKAKPRLKDASARAKEELTNLIEKATNAQRMARDVSVAFKNGEATDNDLDMAVKQSREARDHLKTYLAKNR